MLGELPEEIVYAALVFAVIIGFFVMVTRPDTRKEGLEKAVDTAEKGGQATEAGDHDLAVSYANEALRLWPECPGAFAVRAIALARKKEFGRAFADFGESLRLRPNHAGTLRRRGEALSDAGAYDLAIADFSDVIRLNPGDAEAHRLRAEAYAKKEQAGEAPAVPPAGLPASRPEPAYLRDQPPRAPQAPLPTPASTPAAPLPVMADKSFNTPALVGFVFGLISTMLYPLILLPILAVVFGAIGLGTFDNGKHKAKWMPAVALALGIVYTIMALSRLR